MKHVTIIYSPAAPKELSPAIVELARKLEILATGREPRQPKPPFIRQALFLDFAHVRESMFKETTR